MASNKSYYDILGVKKTASADEIKKAFRKQAQKLHPDAGGDEEQFKQVNEAYAVLSDPQKKAQYDRFGAVGDFAGAAGNPYGGGAYAGGNPFAGAAGSGGVSFDWSDLFGNIRNGDGAFGSNWDFRVNQAAKGRDLQATIELTFEEAFAGTTKKVSIRVPSTGKTETVTAKVPAGAVDGGKLRFKGKGEMGTAGGKRGDLVVVTHIKSHPLYEREKADVLMTLPVTVAEAMLGTTVVVPAPDGTLVKIRVPAGTQSERVLRVKGKGAPKVKGKGTGDLRVRVLVQMPRSMTDEQRAAAEALAATLGNPETVRSTVTSAVDAIKARG